MDVTFRYVAVDAGVLVALLTQGTYWLSPDTQFHGSCVFCGAPNAPLYKVGRIVANACGGCW